MSQFMSMTIALGRNVTGNGGDFHTITVEDGHDYWTLANVLDRLVDAGYEVMSVVIDGYDFTEEMWKHIGHISNLVLLFETLCDDKCSADVICAFITVNDCADVDNWSDSIYFYGTDHESVCREWAECFHKIYEEHSNGYHDSFYTQTDPFPSWLSIDWEDALHNIAAENGSTVVEFAGGVFYFG